jgi:hypothetical protein
VKIGNNNGQRISQLEQRMIAVLNAQDFLHQMLQRLDKALGESFGRIQEEQEKLRTVTELLAKWAVTEELSKEETEALEEFLSEAATSQEDNGQDSGAGAGDIAGGGVNGASDGGAVLGTPDTESRTPLAEEKPSLETVGE